MNRYFEFKDKRVLHVDIMLSDVYNMIGATLFIAALAAGWIFAAWLTGTA